MKIYYRDAFLALPSGTVYCKGGLWHFGGIEIKGDSLEDDWICLNPAWIESRNDDESDQRLEDMMANGASYPMDSAYGRDGCFGDADVFLVFEKPDLEILKELIETAIKVAE